MEKFALIRRPTFQEDEGRYFFIGTFDLAGLFDFFEKEDYFHKESFFVISNNGCWGTSTQEQYEEVKDKLPIMLGNFGSYVTTQ